MQYVIIGCSAGGINAIESIRSKDKTSKIIVISDEKKPLYSRCLLSYLLAGTIREDKIWYRKDNFFKENKVEAILGIKAKDIDTDKKEVYLEDKTRIKFDKLLIATGASAKLENITGVDKKAVYLLRTIDDALKIQSILDTVQHAAVLGGGLIGGRAAYALQNRNKEVTVFVQSPQILSQILDKESASIIQRIMEQKGMRIKTGISVKEIRGTDSVSSVLLDNGSEYNCELVIIGKGVTPNIEIAKQSGLKTNRGIVTDDFLRTSNNDIFAAGDVAESYDIAGQENSSINAIWPSACEQGRIAGLNMIGEKERYDGTLSMNSLEFFDVPVISIGRAMPKDENYREFIRKDDSKNMYKKIVLRGNTIVGAIFVNSVDTIGIVGTLIKNRIDISSVKDIILEDYFNYGRIIKLIKDSKQGFKETVRTL